MISALPSSLRTELDDLESTIRTWPIHVTIDHVIRWILQFETEDYPLAIKILTRGDRGQT